MSVCRTLAAARNYFSDGELRPRLSGRMMLTVMKFGTVRVASDGSLLDNSRDPSSNLWCRSCQLRCASASFCYSQLFRERLRWRYSYRQLVLLQAHAYSLRSDSLALGSHRLHRLILLTDPSRCLPFIAGYFVRTPAWPRSRMKWSMGFASDSLGSPTDYILEEGFTSLN